MTSGRLTGGTLLVIAGVVLLLTNLGVVTADVWATLFSLWPVLLIAWGVSLFFRGSRLSLLGPLVLLVALGYAVAFPGRGGDSWSHWVTDTGIGDTGSRGATHTVSFGRSDRAGVRALRFDIAFGAGELDVRGGQSALYHADLAYRGRKPSQSFAVSGDIARARVWQDHGGVGVRNWDIGLTSRKPLELKVDAGACKALLDLVDTRLTNLEVNCGASDLEARLPEPHGRVGVTISSGASSLRLVLPSGVQARIKSDSVLSSNDISGAGFQKQGDLWRTPGLTETGDYYDIHISNGVGSLHVERGADKGWRKGDV